MTGKARKKASLMLTALRKMRQSAESYPAAQASGNGNYRTLRRHALSPVRFPANKEGTDACRASIMPCSITCVV